MKWNEWLAWHKEWVKRFHGAMKEVKNKRGYYRGERQEAIKQVRKEYMDEFWKTREKILGH